MFAQTDLKKLDLRRIGLFLLIAYAMALISTLAILLTGGLQSSPLTMYLLPTTYMWAPAMANLITRLATGEGFNHTWLFPHLKSEWKFWLLAWFAPGVLIMVGGGLYYLIFPQSFDPSIPFLKQAMQASGQTLPFSPWQLALMELGIGLLIAPLVNSLFTFGEEFGWRAYLLQKLLPLGYRKALVILGIIWGCWHWPIIAIGYNYGSDYAGAPYLGMLIFVWVCFCLGTFLSWAVLKAGSVWPAVIGHAAINGMASGALLFLNGKPNILLGPGMQGLIGIMGFAVLALVLFINPGQLPPVESNKIVTIVPAEEP